MGSCEASTGMWDSKVSGDNPRVAAINLWSPMMAVLEELGAGERERRTHRWP